MKTYLIAARWRERGKKRLVTIGFEDSEDNGFNMLTLQKELIIMKETKVEVANINPMFQCSMLSWRLPEDTIAVPLSKAGSKSHKANAVHFHNNSQD